MDRRSVLQMVGAGTAALAAAPFTPTAAAEEYETVTVPAGGSQTYDLGSVSLTHTAHDAGAIGWYSYHAASDWHADSWTEL